MSERPILGAREHITDQIESHEITQAEVSIAVERFRALEAESKAKRKALVGLMKQDVAFAGLQDKTLDIIAGLVLGSSEDVALSALAKELGPELADVLEISEDAIYAIGSGRAHRRFNWLGASDLMFLPSDLQIDSDTGESYAHAYRNAAKKKREELLMRAQKLIHP